MNWGGAGDLAAAALVVGYVGTVLAQGNPDKLAAELAKEQGFVEFLIAIYVLWALVQSKAVGKVAAPIVTVALLAAFMSFLARAGVMDAFRAWQSGSISMFEALNRMFGVSIAKPKEPAQ